jgi:stage V sporulation protein D (sporulation-specific penicillin-binding protein)
MNQKRTLRFRAGLLRLGFVLLLVVLIGRIGYLQIVDGKRLSAMAQENWMEMRQIEPIRGAIYDANGQKLAYTMPAFYLNLHPVMLKDKDPEYVAQKISDLSKGVIPKDKLYQILSKTDSDGWFTLQTYKIDQKTKDSILDFLKTYTKETDVLSAEAESGVYFMDTVKRVYPFGNFASQVVGFTTGTGEPDSPIQGAAGIELQYNKLLSGQPGKETYMKDRDGNPLPFGQKVYQPPVEGKDVVLTIDETIQRFAEQAVDDIMKKYLPKEATIIVTRPKTGEVLAMANRPSFDPNNYTTADPAALYTNWGVNAVFEPGSTFKVLTLTAGLAEHKVSLDDTFQSGSIQVPGATIHDWNYTGWGRITYREAMIHSSNVGMVQIGQKLGAQLLYKYIQLFGFDKPTGIDLPGESSSLMNRNPEDWKPVDLATTSFGQNIAVTPIQQVAAVGAVANGGYLMKPYVVKEIRDPSTGETIQETKPTVVRQVAPPDVIKTVREVMEEDVAKDETKAAYIPGYHVAGKTGTAQVPDEHGHYSPDEYVCSFIGFAPANDPAIEIYVTVRNPDPSRALPFGNIVASPSAKWVINQTLHYLGVEPDATELANAKSSSGTTSTSVTQYANIPNVVGQTLQQATTTAKQAGFQIQVIGNGNIITRQWPAANQQYVQGTRVIVLAGNSPGDKPKMPDLTGISMREVSDILSVLHVGFTPEGSGFAVSQSIAPGSDIPVNANVKVQFAPRN